MKPKKMFFIVAFLCSMALPIIAQEKGFPIPSGNSKQLFYLQRTPNKNTIVYELNYKNGEIDTEEPIHGFWIRYQEDGQREDLNYIQRKFAYGLKTKKIAVKRIRCELNNCLAPFN